MKLGQYLKSKGFLSSELETLKVKINGNIMFDLAYELKPNDTVTIDSRQKWVSRGAYKLLAAIEHFQLDFKGQVVLDVGSSTGGFTQVSLYFGAKKVYALDVGTNQLNYQLRTNSQVVVYEKTNLKTLSQSLFDEQIDIIVCDVSFISLKHLFIATQTLKHPNLKLVCLIKPQFEAPRDWVTKGYVDPSYHLQILKTVHDLAFAHGFKLKGIIPSPIKGQKAHNIEYIAYYQSL